MSTREKAIYIFNQLTEEQLNAFVTLFENKIQSIPEEEPDELDKAMIEDSKENNKESMPLDEFAKELGFNPKDLRI
ncbi:MAG: hypothetical protein ACI4Q5_09720 [Porcipelethomonas sp.]